MWRESLRLEFLTSRWIVIDFNASRLIAASPAEMFPRSTLHNARHEWSPTGDDPWQTPYEQSLKGITR